MSERALRPFWIHQLAEYLIGVALIVQGVQEPEPSVPVIAGVLVLVNAAVVAGPLGAFRWCSRRMHRWLDVAVAVALLAAALQPWIAVEVATRVLLVVVLVPLGFLWFYTDWAERPGRRQRRAERVAGRTGERAGRRAGRVAGGAYVAGKNLVTKHSEGRRRDP